MLIQLICLLCDSTSASNQENQHYFVTETGFISERPARVSYPPHPISEDYKEKDQIVQKDKIANKLSKLCVVFAVFVKREDNKNQLQPQTII